MQQDQNIKGFTLLELLVVVTIVMVISAVAYPNFSSWSKDREVRKSAEQVSTMLSTITSAVQRGNYSFVQLMVTPQKDKIEIIQEVCKERDTQDY